MLGTTYRIEQFTQIDGTSVTLDAQRVIDVRDYAGTTWVDYPGIPGFYQLRESVEDVTKWWRENA